MNETEAKVLVAFLNASYPHETMEQETFDAYTRALMQLKAHLAAKDVLEGLVFTNPRLPSIAEIVGAYKRYAEQAKRELDFQDKLKAQPEPPAAPPPDEVRELMSRLSAKLSMDNGFRPPEKSGLPREEPGRCDDCGRSSLKAVRFRVGQVVVCNGCAASRLRVKASLT